MVHPNSVIIQTLVPIKAGEEITVAYLELPLELLAPNLARTLHLRSGCIINELGCRCETCRIHLEDEAGALSEAGRDPDSERDVDMDMQAMWFPATAARLKHDERLLTYVMAMVNDSKGEGGMLASNGMRMYYEHFLTPPPLGQPLAQGSNGDGGGGGDGDDDPDAKPPSFCPDLAYSMADIYCRCIIHWPGQEPDNYLFWTALYNDLLRRTVINMPRVLTDALGARCYAALMIWSRVDPQDKASQLVVANIFIEAWLMLRAAHNAMYGHLAFLTLLCVAYPIMGQLVTNNKAMIERKEARVAMQRAEAEAKQQRAETEAKLRQVEAEHAQQGTTPEDVPLASAADDMDVPPAVLAHLEALEKMTQEAVAEGLIPPPPPPPPPPPQAKVEEFVRAVEKITEPITRFVYGQYDAHGIPLPLPSIFDDSTAGLDRPGLERLDREIDQYFDHCKTSRAEAEENAVDAVVNHFNGWEDGGPLAHESSQVDAEAADRVADLIANEYDAHLKTLPWNNASRTSGTDDGPIFIPVQHDHLDDDLPELVNFGPNAAVVHEIMNGGGRGNSGTTEQPDLPCAVPK
jgi:hypothetical protein